MRNLNGVELGPVASTCNTEDEQRQGVDEGRNGEEVLLSAASKDGANAQAPLIETVSAVVSEVIRARTKFPGGRFNMTALTEEVGELAKAFLQRKIGRDKGSIYAEAMQVACVAIRIMEEGDSSFDDVTDAEALT